MSKKRKRFEVTRSQSLENIQVIVDNETGVNYPHLMGTGVIPLIDKDGKPVVTLDETIGFRSEQ